MMSVEDTTTPGNEHDWVKHKARTGQNTYQALSLTTIYYYIFAFFREPRDTESGHFTQLVWDSSTQLGVGVTRSESTGKFYVVMKYWPPGNYIGKYTQHVKPPAQ